MNILVIMYVNVEQMLLIFLSSPPARGVKSNHFNLTRPFIFTFFKFLSCKVTEMWPKTAALPVKRIRFWVKALGKYQRNLYWCGRRAAMEPLADRRLQRKAVDSMAARL